MDTHYLPYFTRENGPKREAACGTWVYRNQHSAEPTCDKCQLYLVSARATEHETAQDRFGVSDPAVKPEKFVAFDCTGGRERR